MATIFVFSGAAGANNGTSWADAYTSLASTNGAAAGDIIKVHKTHTQTGLAANINWASGTKTNPVRIVCVDKDAADAPATGASVEWTTTACGPQGDIYSYGMHWKTTAALLVLIAGTDGFQTHEAGRLVCTGASGVSLGGTRGGLLFRDQDVDFSGASAAGVGINLNGSFGLRWYGGTYTCRATQTSLFTGGGPPAYAAGVHFSGTVTNITDLSGAGFGPNRCRFVGCRGPAYTNLNSGGLIDLVAEFDASGLHGTGTITAPNLPPARIETFCGAVAATLTRYRTGGADDGAQATPYSWEMVSNATAGDFTTSLVSPPVTRWVGTGAQTLTVYVASGVTLQDDEFWVEILGPSEEATPTPQAKFRSSRPAPLATPANLTADGTSTWTGAGVGTKQKVSVAISPTVAGPVTVRVHLAKASTTVYVDPKLDVA